MRRIWESERGFSLIELIFVLLLIGVFVGSGYYMIKNARNLSAERDTETTLSEIIQEVKINVAISGKLPVEINRLPKDGYRREIEYSFASAADICAEPQQGFSINLCRNNDCSAKDELKNVAAVFYSAGNDGIFQLSREGESFTVLQSDDNLRWITYGELASDASCGSFRIITKYVPAVYSASIYEASFTAVPPADSWCIETDKDTAEIIRVSGVCDQESDFKEGAELNLKVNTATFTDSATKLIKVHAVKNGVSSSTKYAVPFYPEKLHDKSGSDILVETKDIVINNGIVGLQGIDVNIEQKDILSSFSIKNDSGAGSVCLWLGTEFELKKSFRMYYEIKTGYKDNDPYSMGKNFGGYGLVVYPLSILDEYPQCGLSGSAGLGYSGLSFEGLGLVMETDLFPDRNLDFKEKSSNNHISFIPCKNSMSDTCLGNHYDELVPQCPNDDGCSEPETDATNWLEDGKIHPMRIELHSNYTDSSCKIKKAGGTYILAEAWVDCTSCSDLTVDYSKTKPDITYCTDSGIEQEMTRFSLGFTFGGEAGTDISFNSFGFRAE
jgi:prepilin-type N-terminal cleavage/methylation domain-containing protein